MKLTLFLLLAIPTLVYAVSDPTDCEARLKAAQGQLEQIQFELASLRKTHSVVRERLKTFFLQISGTRNSDVPRFDDEEAWDAISLRVEKHLALLSFEERRAIVYRYNLDGEGDFTLVALARFEEMTPSRLQTILNRALQKLIKAERFASGQWNVSLADSKRKAEIYTTPIQDLPVPFSPREKAAFQRLKIRNLRDLVATNPEKLLSLDNFGQTTLDSIKAKLALFGLSFDS